MVIPEYNHKWWSDSPASDTTKTTDSESVQAQHIALCFRSSYFRLAHLLRERLPCKAVLALTATATAATQQAIRDGLSIPLDGVIAAGALPSNLHLSLQLVPPGDASAKTPLVTSMPVRLRTLLHVDSNSWGELLYHRATAAERMA